MSSTTRHRAYAWEDQSPTMTAAGTHDGLAILQAIGREELPLPPALRTLDITPVEAEPGRVSFSLVPSEFHLNPFGARPRGRARRAHRHGHGVRRALPAPRRAPATSPPS